MKKKVNLYEGHIEASLIESLRTLNNLIKQKQEISEIAKVLVEAYKRGNKLVLFGNGGSAADAQHIATELIGGFKDHERKSLPALALTTDTSALTAIGNDYGFEKVFSRQVEGLVNKGDVIIALSTSGNSRNVLDGAYAAKRKDAVVIGFTGKDGGFLKQYCDICLCIPSNTTAKIQEAHMTVGHILCGIIEESLTSAQPTITIN